MVVANIAMSVLTGGIWTIKCSERIENAEKMYTMISRYATTHWMFSLVSITWNVILTINPTSYPIPKHYFDLLRYIISDIFHNVIASFIILLGSINWPSDIDFHCPNIERVDFQEEFHTWEVLSSISTSINREICNSSEWNFNFGSIEWEAVYNEHFVEAKCLPISFYYDAFEKQILRLQGVTVIWNCDIFTCFVSLTPWVLCIIFFTLLQIKRFDRKDQEIAKSQQRMRKS